MVNRLLSFVAFLALLFGIGLLFFDGFEQILHDLVGETPGWFQVLMGVVLVIVGGVGFLVIPVNHKGAGNDYGDEDGPDFDLD